MSTDRSELRDALVAALDMARDKADHCGLVGYGVIQRFDGDGKPTLLVPFANLITDTGDAYYAAKGIVGVSPAAPTAPTAITGMQVGTGITVVGKSGAGAAMVTYVLGQAFDATYPSVANLGAGLGVNMVYKTTYAAGSATNTALSEFTITNGTVTTASTTANTISRVGPPTISAINKGASDTLAVTWNHKQLGA